MSDHFITNNKGTKSLSEIINGILPKKATKVDFLVGYFYYSGMKEIYQNISDKHMRILVGLEMDDGFISNVIAFDKLKKKRVTSRQQIRDENLSTLVNLFNQTEHFEINNNDEAFKIYYEKIKNGTLEIRKTVEPSHAKMYIFSYGVENNEDGEVPGTIITGSSNLTYSGLKGQNEINVRFTSKSEFKDASAIFENLWENAIVIADKDHIEEFNEKVIKHIWFEKIHPPYLFYLRVLFEYFKIDYSKHVYSPFRITGGKFYNLKYQEDAIRMGISTIEKHNGVIISDVVGLGKSIVGASIAHNIKLRTIVIAPPHLVPQWEDYCQEFHVTARVFSSGKIESALENYRSKTRLNEKWLIIVDEAHNYRNEFTKDYALLHDLCQGNKVMLLTATPFNNQPSDIYSMVKLFQIPTKSTLQTVDNLGKSFKDLISKYKEIKKLQKDKKITKEDLNIEITKISENIRNIISPLIIRRSRLDLDRIPDYKNDLEKQKINFPKVNNPITLDYKLGELSNLYISTLQRISPNKEDEIDQEDYLVNENVEDNILLYNQFKAARYKPALYVKEEYKKEIKKLVEDAGMEYNLFIGSQRNLAKFMRTLLVRRFESSQEAFKISLDNMLRNSRNVLMWSEKRGAVPVYKKGTLPDIKGMYDSNDDKSLESIDEDLDEAIAKLKPKGLFEINTDYLKDEYFELLKQDIKILETLQDEWSEIGKDPKLETFIEILQRKLKDEPKRKLVVFSQFADTVNYLGNKLKKAGLPVFSYTSRSSNSINKEIIKENFDAGYDKDKQKNKYNILIATDAISEGYNLHRAGAIINYDIPYNPTRVIQRIGRINRINKKMFDE
ncbi:MAG: helicase-related protein, partial [Bacteroides sp.]|nr:helicase-related protein [Bacteroides sp.]